MPPPRTSSLVLHSISVRMVLAFSPGVRLFLPLYPTRSMSAATFSLPSILLLRLVPCLPAGAAVMFILGLVECAPSSGVCYVCWFVVDIKFPPPGCHFGSFQTFGQCFGSEWANFIYLCIYSSYSMDPEGYGRYRRERQQHKQQNRCAKASTLTRQRKSSTGPPPAPIHLCSVVPEKIVILGDAPSQEHRHWCSILYRSSFSWPGARALPLESTHSSPSIARSMSAHFSLSYPLLLRRLVLQVFLAGAGTGMSVSWWC